MEVTAERRDKSPIKYGQSQIRYDNSYLEFAVESVLGDKEEVDAID